MTNTRASLIGAIAGAAIAFPLAMMFHVGSGEAAPPPASAPPCTPRIEVRNLMPPATERTRELEAEVARLELVAAIPDPVAIDWPAGVAASYREPAFRHDIEASLRACRTDLRLAGLSCDEPPCIGVIASGKFSDRPSDSDGTQSWSALDRCEPWAARRRAQAVRSATIDCGDGRYEEVEIIAANLGDWDGWWSLDPMERDRIEARQDERMKQLLDEAACVATARQ